MFLGSGGRRQQDRAGGAVEVPRSSGRPMPARSTRSQASSPRTWRSPPAAAWRAPQAQRSSRSRRRRPTSSLRIAAVPGQLKFDLAELTVAPGQLVEIVFSNPDAMQHNFVLGAVGSAGSRSATPPTSWRSRPPASRSSTCRTCRRCCSRQSSSSQARPSTVPVQSAVERRRLSLRLHIPGALACHERRAARRPAAGTGTRGALDGSGFRVQGSGSGLRAQVQESRFERSVALDSTVEPMNHEP